MKIEVPDKEISLTTIETKTPPLNDYKIFYKTDNMLKPSLLFEENPLFPDEVACVATFAASFDQVEP